MAPAMGDLPPFHRRKASAGSIGPCALGRRLRAKAFLGSLGEAHSMSRAAQVRIGSCSSTGSCIPPVQAATESATESRAVLILVDPSKGAVLDLVDSSGACSDVPASPQPTTLVLATSFRAKRSDDWLTWAAEASKGKEYWILAAVVVMAGSAAAIWKCMTGSGNAVTGAATSTSRNSAAPRRSSSNWGDFTIFDSGGDGGPSQDQAAVADDGWGLSSLFAAFEDAGPEPERSPEHTRPAGDVDDQTGGPGPSSGAGDGGRNSDAVVDADASLEEDEGTCGAQ